MKVLPPLFVAATFHLVQATTDVAVYWPSGLFGGAPSYIERFDLSDDLSAEKLTLIQASRLGSDLAEIYTSIAGPCPSGKPTFIEHDGSAPIQEFEYWNDGKIPLLFTVDHGPSYDSKIPRQLQAYMNRGLEKEMVIGAVTLKGSKKEMVIGFCPDHEDLISKAVSLAKEVISSLLEAKERLEKEIQFRSCSPITACSFDEANKVCSAMVCAITAGDEQMIKMLELERELEKLDKLEGDDTYGGIALLKLAFKRAFDEKKWISEIVDKWINHLEETKE